MSDVRESIRKLWGLPLLPEPHDYSYLAFIQFRDIERCPYISGEPDYNSWLEKDDERLKAIARDRGWKESDE